MVKEHSSKRLGAGFVGRVIFPIWAKRDHPGYIEARRENERTQWWSRGQIEELQRERLQRLLHHAYQNCPFYRDRMHAAGWSSGRINSLKDLSSLPILTKLDIQDHGRAMLATNIPDSERLPNQTGGSTGQPVQFFVDKRRFDSRMAGTHRTDSWAGLVPGEWSLWLWGARMDLVLKQTLRSDLRKHLLYRRIELNTSNITPADWPRALDEIRRRQPRYVVAYAQSAALFARYVLAHNLNDVRFDAVITTAEVLLPGDRELIERAFHTKVFNRYGCREVSTIAAECEQHRGLHVNAEHVFVEIVPDPAVSAPAGRVVVTDLLNYSMPLIRYQIGDVAHWLGSECPCGRGLPLLSEIEGRLTDFLVLADGTHLSGVALLTWVFASLPQVRQVQFVQQSAERILLRLIPGNGYTAETKELIRQKMTPYLRGLATMEFEEVANISSEASGKHRFVLKEFDHERDRETV
jgi:phenylacetate-CoA ligase